MNDFIDFLQSKDISAREIAKKSNLSNGYVSMVLRGERPVTFNFVSATAKALGVDVVTAFKMAGLIKTDGGDQGGGAPASPGVTVLSLPQKVDAVTKGRAA